MRASIALARKNQGKPPKGVGRNGERSGKSSRPKSRKITLSRVIGTTSEHNGALATNPETGDVAYTAGAVVVLVRPTANQQAYFTTPNSKPVNCVAFSPNGRFLAAGEAGHQAAVVVWELATQKVVAEMRGHKVAVGSVCWSQSGKHLASAGVEADGTFCVWSWRTSALIASKALSSRVCAVTSLADGTFVTSGHRHLKFWTLRKPKSGSKVTAAQLDGCPAVLGVERDSTYTSVAGGQGHTDSANVYGISARGLLCLFNAERTIERYVNVKPGGEAGRAFGVAACSRCVAVGCSDGIVRLFASKTLQYIATLPKPAACSRQNDSSIDQELSVSYDESTHAEVFPDAVCLSISDDGKRLSVIYSDHSIYIWDIADPANVGKYRSYLSHAGCVWDIASVPDAGPGMPAGTFATSSADSTIRFWNIKSKQKSKPESGGKSKQVADGPRSVYSRDTVSMIYCGGTSSSAFKAWKAADPESTLAERPGSDVEVRCLKISPDGSQLASGDRMGNIRVHELEKNQLYAFHEAHDGEVTALDFSSELREPNAPPRVLLASASKDNFMHIFDSTSDYQLAQTSVDHTAAVTGLCFADHPTYDGACRLMTCSSDKTIVFRTVSSAGKDIAVSKPLVSSSPTGRLHALATTHDGQYSVTVSGDQALKIWDNATGVLKRTIKTDGRAEPIKVVIDPSDTLMAVCSSDRGIRLYELKTGDLHCKVRGHSEVVTGITFSSDGSELVTVSADSCIFVWRIGADLQRVIRHKIITRRAAQERRSRSSPSREVVKDVPALQLDAVASAVDKRPQAAGAINLSNTLTPAWAKDASIEVAHQIVKSARKDQPSVVAPTSARSESSASDSSTSSRWTEAGPTVELYVDPSQPSSPAPSHWDDVSCSQDNSSPIARRLPADKPEADQPTGQDEKSQDTTAHNGDGPSILMDDMVVCDMSDEEDDAEGVVYFGSSKATDHQGSEKFEVTQSISVPAKDKQETAVKEAEEEEEPLATSSTKVVIGGAAGAGSDSEAEYALPTWLSTEVPSGDKWAADANASMRRSFSSRYREQARKQQKVAIAPKALPASPARLTLKQEREALKKAEQAERSSASSSRNSGSFRLPTRGVGMSLLGEAAKSKDSEAAKPDDPTIADTVEKGKESVPMNVLQKQKDESARHHKTKNECADASDTDEQPAVRVAAAALPAPQVGEAAGPENVQDAEPADGELKADTTATDDAVAPLPQTDSEPASASKSAAEDESANQEAELLSVNAVVATLAPAVEATDTVSGGTDASAKTTTASNEKRSETGTDAVAASAEGSAAPDEAETEPIADATAALAKAPATPGERLNETVADVAAAAAAVAEVTSAAASAAEIADQAAAAVAATDAATRVAAAESARAAVVAAAALAVDITEQKGDSVDEVRAALEAPCPTPAETTDEATVKQASGTLDHPSSVEPSGSILFGSSKTESEVFGSARQTASTTSHQKVSVGIAGKPNEADCPQPSPNLGRSFDGASALSMPAMPLSSDDEGEDAEGSQDNGHHRSGAKSQNQAQTDESVPPSQPVCSALAREAAEDVDSVPNARDAKNGSRKSADDEAAARLKMEKVVRRMAAEFEEDLAAVKAKAAAEKEEVVSQLQAEKAAHTKAVAASEAAAAEAAAAMTAMQRELEAVRAQLAASKQELMEKEKEAVDMADKHSMMKSEAAEAATKAADALTTVLAWSSNPLPTRG